jgi:hypothetical protein
MSERCETPSPSSPLPRQEDARDLLARLYREIGIAAVAAALQVTAFDTRRDSGQQWSEFPRPPQPARAADEAA